MMLSNVHHTPAIRTNICLPQRLNTDTSNKLMPSLTTLCRSINTLKIQCNHFILLQQARYLILQAIKSMCNKTLPLQIFLIKKYDTKKLAGIY